MQVGDVLTRDDGQTFRLVGVQRTTGEWIAEALDNFAAPVTLSARDLAVSFAVEAPTEPPAAVEEQHGWNALADANTDAHMRIRRGEIEQGPSPEDVFRALEPKPPAKRRKR